MKKITQFIKRFILSFFVLYGFNMIVTNFNIVIPINFITVGLMSFLGLPALFSLVLLYVFIR